MSRGRRIRAILQYDKVGHCLDDWPEKYGIRESINKWLLTVSDQGSVSLTTNQLLAEFGKRTLQLDTTTQKGLFPFGHLLLIPSR
jgi:hypothetical protein